MTCPAPETWIDLASGEKAPEALLEHLSACPECRHEAAALARDPGSAPRLPPDLRARILGSMGVAPRRALWIRAAAAALLATGAAFWFLRPRARPAAPVASPVEVAEILRPAAPGEYLAGDGGRVLDLGFSRISCAPGSRAAVRENGEAVLEEGAAWVAALSPLSLQTPLGTLKVAGGEVGVRLEPASVAFSLLRDAWAAGPSGMNLVLLEGATVRLEAAVWTGPCRVRLAPGQAPVREALDTAALDEAFAWRDLAEGGGDWREVVLRETPVGAATPESKTSLFPLPQGVRHVAVEAEILAPAGSQTALCFPDSGRTLSTVVGAAGASGWQVVRLRRDGRFLRVYAGAAPVASAALPLGEGLKAAADFPAVGLVVWNGPVKVRRLRWRALK